MQQLPLSKQKLNGEKKNVRAFDLSSLYSLLSLHYDCSDAPI